MSLRAQLTRIDFHGHPCDGSFHDGIQRTKEVYIIDRSTQLGRLDPDAPPSKMVDEAEFAFDFKNPHGHISARHALISLNPEHKYPFALYDLGSSNGTYLNGYKLVSGYGTNLVDNDVISLSRDLRLQFSVLPSDAPQNHAVMIGGSKKNLWGVENDLLGLKRVLEPRGFRGNIEGLMNGAATRKRIFEALSDLRVRETRDSISVFYYSGHGSRTGELILDNGDRIGAKELMDSLSDLRGKLLLILDGCHTEVIADAGIPENSCLIGHAGTAYEGAVTSIIDVDYMSPYRPTRGYTTQAIMKILKKNPHRIAVDELVEGLRWDPRVLSHQNIGFHANTRIVMPTGQ